MDIEALAKQYGAKPTQSGVPDPEALAAQYGATKIDDATPYVPGLSEGLDALTQIPRQVGLTLRAGIGGLGGIANLALDPAVAAFNAASGANLPMPSQAMERTLTRAGLPEPATPVERIAQAGARGMVPVGATAKVAEGVKSLAPLADNLVTQFLSSVGGSTASQGAQEAGAPPLVQAGAGLVGGVLAPTSLAAANAAVRAGLSVPGSLLAPFTQAGRTNAVARLYQNAALSAKDAAQSINSAPDLVPGVQPTSAELANDPGLSALYKVLRNQNTPEFASREASNDAARQAYLAQTFGNQTDLNAAKAAREDVTAPLRDQALASANEGAALNAAKNAQIIDLQGQAAQKAASKVQALQNAGQLQTAAAQHGVYANDFTPVPGMPRVPASLSNNQELVAPYQEGAQQFSQIAAQREAERQALEGAAQTLAARPDAPSLKAAPLLQSIQAQLSEPGLRASDVVQKTLGAVQSKIAQYADANGVIDARDLYTIRKELGNTISGFAKDSNNWDKRLTAGLEQGIQGEIDKAIVGAGGIDWPAYLEAYRNQSAGINGMQLGQDISKAAINPVTERLSPAQFSRQMANNGPDVAAAGPRYSDALTRVNEDLKRSVAPLNSVRTAGSDTAQNLIGTEALQRILGRGPSGSVGRVIGKLLSVAYSPMEAQTRQLAVNGMLDPRLGAGLLTRAIPVKPDLTQGLLRQLLPISYGGLLGTISAQ